MTGDIGGSPVTGDAGSDDLEVIQLLGFSKSFDGPTTATGMATLTFTITNPGTDTASDIEFSDNLDDVISGLIATSLPAVPCGAGSSITGISLLTFTGGELPPSGGMCSFDVDVLVPATATAGDFPNVTSDLFQQGLTVAAPATADLTIEPPPTFAKVFSPDAILAGGTSTLTFTIDNSLSSLAANGLAFTDGLPAGVVIATPSVTANTCGGTLTATAGSGTISLTGGSVSASSTCTIDVEVTSITAGMHVNTTLDLISTSGNSGTATDTLTVTAAADLSVTKTDGVTSATPGGSVTYTITVTNPGPSADPSVTLTDTFPSPPLTCTYTSVAAGGASGNTAAGVGDLAETLSMPAGSSVTYTASCDIDADATGTLSNTATITPSITDTNAGNNSATDGDTVLAPEADLGITKDDGVTSAVPGQDTVTYTIAASNAGPSDDPSVSVTDTFPSVLTCTYTSVAAGGASGNTAAGSGDLAETLSMPAGSSVTYTVSCDIDADATGTLSNTATISGSVTDPASGNDSATDGDTVLSPEADLSVTKDDGVTSAVPGQDTLTYIIVASNSGPSDDPAATLADTFPTDLTCTYTSVAAAGASGNTAAGSGDLAETLSLPVGSSVTYTVSCTIAAAATGTLSNTATVTASVTDPVSGNDSATDSDTVLAPEADLAVTKDDGTTTATPGGSVAYTIVAANAGPSDDPTASVADTFPADLTCTYTSVAAAGASGNTAAGSGDIADTLSLPVGSSVTYTATCDIDAAATGTLSNTATITESVIDPNAGDNSATDGDTVLSPEADLSVTKDDGVTAATPGGTVTYTIVAANAGPSDDPAATVADTFPADLTCTYTSIAAAGASGNTSGSGDIADALSLPSGSSVTYTADCDIDPAATGTLSNTATITESVTDPDTGNNSATDDDTVLGAEADLDITKTDGVTAAVPGETVTYTIVASNAGPSDDPTASVADTFPTDLTCTYTSVAAGGSSGNTAAGSGDIADTLSLPSGSSVTYTADCDIDPAATGILSNTATITASVTDPDTGNNSATDDDTSMGESGLSITKTGSADPVNAGDSLTYTLDVLNGGPSDAPDVMVFDLLPDEATYSSDTDSCSQPADLTGLRAALDPSQEVPPVASSASGLASFVLNTSTNELKFALHVESIDNISMAHIHSGAAGSNGAVVQFLYDGTPTFDPANPIAGTIQLTAVEAASLLADPHYVNVHTTDFPGGEIRGQITVTAQTPLQCSLGTIAASGSSSFDVTVDVAADTADGSVLRNVAIVMSSVTDPAAVTLPAPNGSGVITGATDELQTTVATDADLSVTKTDSADPVTAGNSFSYTVTASNAGPSDAQNVVVTDTLPAGVTLVSTAGCAEDAAGVPTCTLGTIAAGDSAQYTITVMVDASTSGVLTNAASVASDTADANSGNDSTTEDTTVAAQAELSISKTDSVDPVIAGNSLTYTVTVDNAGPSDAQGVVVTDTLPAGVTLVSTAGCAEDPAGVPTCTLGTITAGGSAQFTVTVTVDADTTGVITNAASVTASTADTNSADNSTTEDTTVETEADLSITKTDGVTTAVPGQSTVTYTIVATNAGPSDDPAATVTDVFPADLTCTYTSVAAGGASGNTSGSGDIADTLSLPVGSAVTYTADCTIDPAATGTLSNTATITASATDSVPSNNSATDDDTVLTPEADLSVTKVDNIDPVVAGTGLIYTVTVTNAGPSEATSVTATDTLPADVTLVSTSGCVEDPVGVPTCSLGTLAPGASAAYTIEVAVDSGAFGVITNNASVTSEVTDPVAGNDSTSEDTTVVSESDIVVTKTDGLDVANPGDEITYTITVTKAGPSDAPGTTVSDTFPAAFTAVTWTCTASAGSSCTAAGTGDINDVIDLAAGGTATYLATGTIDVSFAGILENSATATPSPDVVDTDLTNNTATDTTAVTSPADVSGTMSIGVAGRRGTGGFAVGDTVIYTVTLINSSSTAQFDNPGHEFIDELPPELTLLAASADSGSTAIDEATNTATWDGVIPGGGTIVISIEARIDYGAGGSTVTNQGTILFDADGDGSNESTALTDDPSVDGVDDPTSIIVGTIVEIPALGPFGLLLLAFGLALKAVAKLRSARQPGR